MASLNGYAKQEKLEERNYKLEEAVSTLESLEPDRHGTNSIASLPKVPQQTSPAG